MRRLLPALLALLAFPAAASAHSTIQIYGQEIVYASEDAVSDNDLLVEENATEIRFFDPQADAGVQATDSRCRSGQTAQQGTAVYVIEVFCRKMGLARVSIDVGPNQDKVLVKLADPQWQVVGVAGGTASDRITVQGNTNDVLSGDQGSDIVDGGGGNDDLRGEDGDDTLVGGPGNDKIQAGTGADKVDGGDGDDEILTPDGLADTVSCGSGADKVKGDTVDSIGPDCEAVERGFVAPPADQPAGDDKTKPRVQVGGSTMQRVSKRRRSISLAVVSNEKGEVSASGFLDSNGFNLPLKSKSFKIDVAGGGVLLKIVIPNAVMKHVLRDFKRGKRPVARLNVVATDVAGNAAIARKFKLRLRR